MNFIRNIIKRVITEEKKILGRWNIEYCDKRMNNKIDLSNEDHCGTCGEYRLDKIKTKLNPDELRPSVAHPEYFTNIDNHNKVIIKK